MPRAFDKLTDKRINLPRPPGNELKPAPRRPAVSPTGSPDVRKRRGEVVRPVPQAPAHTKRAIPRGGFTGGREGRFVRRDGRMEGGLLPKPPQAEVVETQEKVTPDGGREVRQRLEGERVAEEFKQEQRSLDMQKETEMAPEGSTKPPPPKKTSPLGQNSPIEQLSQQEPMPQGRDHHLRQIGIDESLPPAQAKTLEAQTIRDFQRFGSYEGEDDPEAPPPPIRPGKNSYNPATGEWLKPEGKVSMLDRLTTIAGVRSGIGTKIPDGAQQMRRTGVE